MFKVLIVVLVAVVCCQSQLDIPRKTATIQDTLLPAPIPAVGVEVAPPEPVAVAAPAIAQQQFAIQPAFTGANWGSNWGWARGQLPIPIQKFRTQEVLPVQDLGVVNGGPQVIQVRSEQEPVLVHFQSQSAPVQVETSHIPSPPGETTVTQTRDEPHTVIHEVIRPVIQEVREIIQPYRRVTQEVRPVQEEVHTDVSTNTGAAVASAGPAAVAVAAPTVLKASAPAPITLAAPQQTYWATAPQHRSFIAEAPQQTFFSAAPQRNYYQGLIAAPAPVLTGSYIQQFIEQLGLRRQQGPIVTSGPQVAVTETVEAPAPAAVAVEAVEPIAAEAADIVPVESPKFVGGRVGSASFTRTYWEN